MNVSVYAHVQRDDDAGRYAVLEAGGLAVFINDRAKALEIASALERVASEWEGEV